MPSRNEEIAHAIARAQDQTRTLEAREAAIEELREKGFIDEVGVDSTGNEPDDVEAELAALKRELEEAA